MGESIVKNVDPRLGSIEWARWTNRAGNQALVKGQLTTLIPVQELLPFQRQIRDQDIPLALVAGQSALFSATVPIDEAWKLINVTLSHDDSIDHVVRLGYLPRRGAGNRRAVSRQFVTVAVPGAIYNSSSELAVAALFSVRGPVPVEFFPNDVVELEDLSLAVDANVVWKMSIRYELIPLPLDQELSTKFTAAAI